MKLRLAFHDATAGQPSSNGSVYDKLIEWRTKSPFVHVELVIDVPFAAVAAPPAGSEICYSSVPGPGVRLAYVDITKPWWKVVDVPGVDVSEHNLSVFIGQYMAEKYDWLGIIGFGSPLQAAHLHDDDDKFCSEVCTRVLQDCGLFPHVKPWCVSPGDLYRMVTK